MIVPLATAAALIPYLLLTWFLGSFLKLKSPDIWILRAGLALIGLAVAALFLAQQQVGALQPRWRDGHSTGLYSFQYLRRLSSSSMST